MPGIEMMMTGALATVVLMLVILLALQLWLAVRLKRQANAEAQQAPQQADYGMVLRVEMGGEEGRQFRLRQKGSTWIGRDNSVNDIVLPGSSVSRRHSRIESDGTNFYVHDTGSTNGTFVNGQQVSTAMLRNGDTLTIGNIVLRFIAPGKRSH